MPKLEYVCPECNGTFLGPSALEGRSSPCPICRAEIDRWPSPRPKTAPPPAPPKQKAAPSLSDSPLSFSDSLPETQPKQKAAPPPAPKSHQKFGGRKTDDFWSFRTMLIPKIVQVAFIIMLIACILVGFQLMVASVFDRRYPDLFLFLLGFILTFVGPLLCRLVCEFTIIFFRINETLTEIKNALERDGRDGIELDNN